MLPCLSKQYLGFDCMGCGLQRSVALILNGKFVDAFYMYPATYPLVFLIVYLIFDNFIKVNHSEKIKLILSILTLVTAIVNYLIKIFFI